MSQGGRAYDPAPYIAFCMHRLRPVNRAVAWHMGKIVRRIYSLPVDILRKNVCRWNAGVFVPFQRAE